MDPKRIYHIYKACRLCGAGGGYKMPIYQNFVDLNDTDMDIGQKIRDCVQIEVYDGDKMPPLICEVCVDKVNDYYHFKQLCKETNIKTRKKLGLPHITAYRPDSADCTVGLPKQIYTIKKEPDEKQTKIDSVHAKKESALKEKETQLKNRAKELKTKEDNLKKKDTTLKALNVELKNRHQQQEALQEQLTAREMEIKQKETEQEKSGSTKQLHKEQADLKKEIYNLKRKESYWKHKQQETQRQYESEIEKLKLEISSLRTGSGNLKRKNERELDEVDRSSRSSSVSNKPMKRSKRSQTPNKQDDTHINIDRSSRSSSVSSKPTKRSKRSQTPNKQDDTHINIAKEPLVPSKKTKELKIETPTSKKPKVPSPKSAGGSSHPPEAEKTKCVVCGSSFKNKQALSNHMRCHAVTFSLPGVSSTKSAKGPSHPPEADKTKCVVCGSSFKNRQALSNHMRCHTVTFTLPRLACDACKVWFTTNEEINSHHRSHKTNNIPYKCDFCDMEYNTDKDYHEHFSKHDCIPFYIVPDVQCLDCWNYFATETLKCQHKCLGEDGRPGGKCGKCNQDIPAWKEFVIHEATCKGPTKAPSSVSLKNGKADPEVLARLLPMQVRLIKCDSLINRNEHGYCNVATVKPNFGLDKHSVYPYMLPLRIKQEPIIPIDHMVSINPDVEDEFYTDYVHWDSDDVDSDDEQTNTLSTLTALCLKVIFSKQMLGKVPRKRKRVTTEKAFDAMSDNDAEYNIDNIIDSLGINIDNDNKDIVGNDDSDANVENNKCNFITELNNDQKIKLLRMDIENDDTDEASSNKDLSRNDYEPIDTNNIVNKTLETDKKNETQSNPEIAQVEPFHKVDSFDTNDNIADHDDSISQTDKDNQVDDCSKDTCVETEQNSQNKDLNGINIDTNSIKSVTEVNAFDNTESNECSINENIKNDETQMNNDDIETKTTDHTEVRSDNYVINEEKQTKDYNPADSDEILENNSEVDEDKTEINLNLDTTDNGTEMDTLMKDLSDLSKTDDTQHRLTNKNDVNIEKSESDTENDKFMKELDEQIGETNEQTDNVKENDYNESNIENDSVNGLKADTFDDFNKINTELEQRMEKDLDNISEEEFDFDA